MSGPLTVGFVGDDLRGAYRPLLAGFPVSLINTDGEADLVIAFGGASLAQATARARRGIVLVDPTADDTALPTEPSTIPITLSETFAGNPAVAETRELLQQRGRPTLLEVRAEGVAPTEPMRDVLLQLLRVVEVAGFPAIEIVSVTGTDRALLIDGEAIGGIPLALSVSRSNAAARTIEFAAQFTDGSIAALVPDGRTARPANIEILDPDGAHHRPTRYGTALRDTIERLVSGQQPPSDPSRFVNTARLASRIAGPRAG